MSDIVFAKKQFGTYTHGTWKVLIADDDPGTHAVIKLVLKDLVYQNRSLEFFSARSRAEAEEILKAHRDIAIALLDIVMEEEDSGPRLVRFIREELQDQLVRIIFQTGHPGKMPAEEAIAAYDVNDYEEKTDLTAQRLCTTVVASLRNYQDLQSLEANRIVLDRHRIGLTKTIDASAQLYAALDLDQFTQTAYSLFLNLAGSGAAPIASSFAALQDESDFRIVAADGAYAGSEERDPRSIIGEATLGALYALRKDGKSLLLQDRTICLYEDARRFRMLLCLDTGGRLEIQVKQLLDVFASGVSLAFESLRLKREIAGTRADLILRLAEAVETRSHETAQHVRRVGEFSELIGRCSGLDDAHARELKAASALHDIGKIGIPDDILLKPGLLTEDEFRTMKTHTGIGYELLKNSSRSLLKTAAIICRQHHEQYDGKGYPSGISGESIHINARIVGICDVFDSLSHGRPQRGGWETDKVLSHLSAQRGRAFDPQLVDIFLENIDSAVKINTRYPD